MIKYNDEDWKPLTRNAELKEGDYYIVHNGDSKQSRLMRYSLRQLIDWEVLFNIQQFKLDSNMWFMEFEWPSPPRALSEISKVF